MLVRAAMHIHSNWSHDGSWPLSKLAFSFGKVGYHILFTTEHDESFDNSRWLSYRQACTKACNGRILIVPGIEYSDPSNTVHVLVWGEMPFLGAGSSTDSLLESVRAHSGVAVLAHPSRRDACQKFDASWVPFLFGIEQWNRKVDGVAPSREAMSLLNKSPGLVPFVGLDFHTANQFFPLVMMLYVEGRLCEESALAAFRERRISAEVLGMSLKHFTKKGAFGSASAAAERLRRSVRSIIRKA